MLENHCLAAAALTIPSAIPLVAFTQSTTTSLATTTADQQANGSIRKRSAGLIKAKDTAGIK